VRRFSPVDDLLDEITTSSDAGSFPKPSPDIVEAALSKLNMQPRPSDACDTPYDIRCQAGVGMIAVRCGALTMRI